MKAAPAELRPSSSLFPRRSMVPMFLSTIKTTIERFRMIEPGDTVVAAVSGGPDSVCLLSVLHDLAADWDLTLHVAHLDHRFRGEGSAQDARFVQELADRLGVPATIEHIDVPAFCREQGLSPQEGARAVRYSFLDRVGSSIGAERIALGHTASDQAETFLLRLLRGAGITGLSGIPPKRERYIRPLIEVLREEVLDHLRERGLPFVTDPSNLSPVYTRNRVRLELMPALREFNPRIEEALATEAALLRDEEEVLIDHARPLIAAIVAEEGEAARIARDAFGTLSAALQRRVLRAAFTAAGGETGRLSAVQTEAALSFMASAATGRAMELPGGMLLEREYDAFILRPSHDRQAFRTELIVPGLTRLPELGVTVETGIRDAGVLQETAGNYRWQALFDYDKIATPLMVRNRQDGDRFHPAGLRGRSKKLQDFFVDEKIPRRQRDSTPLLATGQGILWVIGMRTDERFLPGPSTERVLVVTVWDADNTVRGKE